MRAALIEIAGGAILAIGDLPFTHVLPDGGKALLTDIGQEVPAHNTIFRVVEYLEVDFDRPGTFYTQAADVLVREGDLITVTRGWTAWTQQAIDTFEAARRDDIIAAFDTVDDISRAAALVTLDELNRHATLTAAILQAVADATTLANLKSGMALIEPIAQRTPAQIKAAIRAKLGVV